MAALFAALVALTLAFWAVPVVRPEAPLSPVLLDREGRLLGAAVAADEQWRFPARPVPEKFAVAVVAWEDRRFGRHPGVDPLAVARAAWTNLRAGRVVSGASTLPMQVVRLARHNPPRTFPEKALEALLAVRLRASATPDQILAMYAAHAPFGGNTVGLEAAAWRTFGRGADDLSWAEAATLAVLPNAPSQIYPGVGTEALRAKRNRLLDRLAARGHLPAADAALAREEPLPAGLRALPRLAPHLVARVRGTGQVLSTLDQELQQRTEEVVARHAERLAHNRVHHLAVLVAEVSSGRVVAYAGNVRPHGLPGDHVDVVRSPRSTGSLLKPFLYASMLEEGELLPRQLVPDLPMRIGGFAPENYDRTHEGALPAHRALARSRNVPAAWLLQQFGVDRFAATLRARGMGTLHRQPQDYGLALILGGAEGTLWDMTAMYRDLALAVDGTAGPALHWHGAPPPRVGDLTDAAAAWLTLEALVEVQRPGVDAGWRGYQGARRIAWKTGTSYGFRDGWAIGVSPAYAIGVWAGNATGEGRPGLTGLEAAAPVLFDLFGLVDTGGWFAEPAAVATVQVCAHSGMRAGPDCAETRAERVPPAGRRTPPCSFCERVHVDLAGRHRVHAGCEPVARIRSEGRFVLPPGMAWFYRRRHADLAPLPPWRADCADVARAPMACLVPSEGAEIYVPVDLDGQRGRVVLQAAHTDQRAVIHWHIDARYVGATEGLHELAVAPGPGRHLLTLVDGEGARLVRSFTVL